MYFDLNLGYEKIPADAKVICREAVRGIAVNEEQKILMVRNSKGDCKFPGGGVEAGEDHVKALCREFREETGYAISDSIELVGMIVETNTDCYDPSAYFIMKSYYYTCRTTGEHTGQCLDPYEQELNFEPVFLTLAEACQMNQQVLDHKTDDMNSWVERETMVLKILAERGRTELSSR